MISGVDIVVLARLLADQEPWTFRSLGDALGMDPAALHRSVARLKEARLLDGNRQVNRSAAEEFLIHAVLYLAPVAPGALVRGMPTAWAAEPLRALVADDGEPLPVWPDPRGEVRGQAVEPLAEGVADLSRTDPELHEWFALIDGIRIGRARERKLAAEELSRRIWSGAEDS